MYNYSKCILKDEQLSENIFITQHKDTGQIQTDEYINLTASEIR